MAEHIDVEDGEKVLDIGTGCGLLAVLAAEKAGDVVTIDVNPQALRCAKFNAELNCIADKFDIILSDLFAGLKKATRFDIIICNLPYLPVEAKAKPEDWLERAWYGGRSGRQVIDKFLKNVNEHVAKGVKVFMVQSSLSNPEQSVKMFRKIGFEAEIIAKEELFFEKIVVIRAEKLS